MNYACKWGLNRHYGHAVGQKARKGASISSLSLYRLPGLSGAVPGMPKTAFQWALLVIAEPRGLEEHSHLFLNIGNRKIDKNVPFACYFACYVGIDYDLKPGKEWPITKVVSPEKALGKSHAIRALKIQMGLKCNAKCGYCNQTARPSDSHGTPRDAEAFLGTLSSWLQPAGTDGLGDGLRIEFWGGEPLLYWNTMKCLAEALHERYPKVDLTPMVYTQDRNYLYDSAGNDTNYGALIGFANNYLPVPETRWAA